MSENKHSENIPNTPLWRARRKSGFERKRSSWLLGHRTPDTIARYERGETEPNLDNAIRLSIIYGSSIEELFPHKYEAFRHEIGSKFLAIRKQVTPPVPSSLFERINSCSYESALKDPSRSAEYFQHVRDHITRLAKHLAGLS